jgi:glycosyltransferase involved in cell wall biosynthesis
MIGTLERGGGEGQLVAWRRAGSDALRRPRVLPHERRPARRTTAVRGHPDRRPWLARIPAFAGLGAIRGVFSLLAVLNRLRRYFRQHRPHIVQGQLFWAYVLGALAAVPAGVAVMIGCRRSLPIFKGGNARHLWLEQLANRVTTLVVANSATVRATAIETEGLPADKLITIHNGVTEPAPADATQVAATRASLAVAPDAAVVVCVANLIEYKGHRDLLAAWADVRQRCPSAVLWLVGDGAERRDRTHAEAVGACTCWVARRCGLLASAALLVQASHHEGLPNAVLEGMAAGLPVVATNVWGTAELVVDGETGLLVAPRDPARLASAIATLLEDADARARMGRAALERVRASFSMTHMVSRYEQLYDRLLTEGGH